MPERLVPWLRVLFLGAVLVFAWLSLRGRFSDIWAALGAVSPVAVLLALLLVLVGLTATSVLWLRLLPARLSYRDGAAIFFVGQLGKYLPGSVWSLGAQATLARRFAVPARTTVRTGLVFLAHHLVTGVVLGSTLVLLGALDTPWPRWLFALPLLGSLAFSLVRPLLVPLLLMALTWSAYSLALVLLTPTLDWAHLPALAAAFALSYAAGVLVVLAPAGVGAREAVFVLLVAPLIGVPQATALALLARVVHTTADGLLALGWWAASQPALTSRSSPAQPAAGRPR